MKNELLLKQAIELLQKVDPDELEIVQIDNTKYDDGSIGFNVSLTYPSNDEAIGSSALKVDGKKIGELVEPHVTRIQQEKQTIKRRFQG